ncbi:MAG: DNA internalization-related competence protein ComEC/Rec2 [Firmicutes bacterium]|nr:DNA internalization-related competence protein ComEC/Rec2 [Bacillota bacterium]
MKRPIAFVFLFLIIGIIFGQHLNLPLGVALFGLIVIVLDIYIVKKTGYKRGVLLIAAALLGFCIALTDKLPYNNVLNSFAYNNSKASLEGSITDKNKTSKGIYVYKVKASGIYIDGKAYKDNKALFLYSDKSMEIGDIIEAEGKISLPPFRRNIVERDMEAYCRYNGVRYVFNGEDIKKTGEEKNIYTLCRVLRKRFSEVYDNILPRDTANVVKAIVLGEKSDLPEYSLYTKVGIVHVLAISGLHISVLSAMLLFVLKRITGRFSDVLVLIILVLYTFLTGAGVSTLRACIMFAVLVGGRALYRNYDIISSACTACILLLLYRPAYIYSPGFLYSFCCIFSIGFITDIVRVRVKEKRARERYILFLMPVTVVLLCKPLSVYYNYSFTPYDILANTLAIPLISISLVFSLLAGVVGLFSLALSKFMAGTVYVLINTLSFIAKAIANLPYSTVQTGGIRIFSLIVIYVFILLLYNIGAENIDIKAFYKSCKIKKISSFLSFILLFVFLFISLRMPQKLVLFPYMGNSDCALVKYKDYAALCDAGQDKASGRGESVLLPYIKYYNITKLEDVFISHTDTDHIDALYEIADYVDIKNVYFGENVVKNQNYKALTAFLKERDIPVHYLKDEEEKRYKGFYWRAYLPEVRGEDANENSLVMKLKMDDTSFLFTGDIGEEAEKSLLDKKISADYIKVPHHGSEHSSSREFLEKVSPGLGVVTCGYKNIYGHPHEKTKQTYKDLDIPLYTTADYGAVTVDVGMYTIYTVR